MEFKQPKRKNPNLEHFSRDELNLAYEFSKRIYDEFGTILKAVVLFGSAARRAVRGLRGSAEGRDQAVPETSMPSGSENKGDIDILIVVDDVTLQLTPELVEAYRIIIDEAILAVSPKLHVTSLKLTNFWEYVRTGDPVAVNLLRDGLAILDTGFFEPLQALLIRGRIRPTPEAISTYFFRAPKTLHNSKWHILQATLDLYWAAIDAAHAALMKVGEIPPSPEHVADLLEEKLVRTRKLERKYAEMMRNFYQLSKRIIYREIKEVTAAEYDHYYRDAEAFVNRMERFIKN
ncbi:hypothetical protein COV22_02185 [Candidatus Woesearchaeota archaeon CG10_big_fil_rev_8_21_14_0_10_47_5]|nr:MAG: hypothetical protein AUJ69_03415 [Candidatus Woesearchaeota archaeon CG1_02_47_18]PIN72838.1 MAG: hypothetical protein COV22_02185 [Candidatus Woesearchaeota archaeon CG10_big_fil_rev_8_21_14_0_10_47_5]HII29589.1 hypothetical protein [Candidatus Woesearchaeota archaeon]